MPFALFFALVLLVHRLLRPGLPRKSFLLVASYVFYGCWDWRFLGLIFGSTLVDYLAGAKIHEAANESMKKRWLWLSLIVNLGALGFFKYYNFFVSAFSDLFGSIGLPVHISTLEIVLPVGISFYTFQTLSYSIDIYRGRLRPAKSLIDFALFVAFFPQLVAGPIVRAAEFLPQLGQGEARRTEDFLEGLERLLIGLLKKVMVADIAARMVDPIFADPAVHSGAVCAAGALAFTCQIYFDFSGYSDMAIGLARMLGYRLPENFRLPYLASSMTEFWRRWHISLSLWFRDYLYIPLGGNRGSKLQTGRNLVLTFLLTGLWHGANWTFIVFGAWHGALLLIERLGRGKMPQDQSTSILSRFIGTVYCCLATTISFAIFRSTDMGSFLQLLDSIVSRADGADLLFSPVRFYYLSVVCVGYHVFSALNFRRWARDHWDPWIWRPFFYALVVLVLLSYAPMAERSFIYFAF